jgi:DNA topoisomerase I
VQAYVEGELALEVKQLAGEAMREDLADLKPEEAAVLALLESRLNRSLSESLEKSVAAARSAQNARSNNNH